MHFAEKKLPNATLGQACTNPSNVFCMGSGIGWKQNGDWGLCKGKVATAETPIRIRNKRNIGKYRFKKKQNPAGASSWSRKKRSHVQFLVRLGSQQNHQSTDTTRMPQTFKLLVNCQQVEARHTTNLTG
jgi:hypothetical protein